MKLVEQQIRPSQIITKEALENTVTLLSAIGGSLNAMIHLPALAAELGLELDWDDIAKITSKTPVLCGIVPNGNLTAVDLHYAGGIPAVMKELRDKLHGECLNVCGLSLGEILEQTKDGDRTVIHTAGEPLEKANGIQVLYGNLAPQGALVKTSAVPENVRVFEGTAKVFDGEDACYAAFRDHAIHEGDAVIVRYEGPKGGPGMKELHRITEIIKGIPRTAVITDGRFSGASRGASIGHVSPEAAVGGPIALVEEGDIIKINIPEMTLDIAVSDEEMAARKAKWQPREPKVTTGYLARYASMVTSGNRGAILQIPGKND